jgi:hypothetical protein
MARLGPTQDSQSFTEIDFRVKGVGLGSSQARVVRHFGRPISRKRERIVDEHEVCGSEDFLAVHFVLTPRLTLRQQRFSQLVSRQLSGTQRCAR